MMRGDLSVVSEPGVGSRFRVSFPVDRCIQRDSDVPSLSSVRVLLCERDDLVAESLYGMARSWGVQMQRCRSVSDCLLKVERVGVRYSFVVLDCNTFEAKDVSRLREAQVLSREEVVVVVLGTRQQLASLPDVRSWHGIAKPVRRSVLGGILNRGSEGPLVSNDRLAIFPGRSVLVVDDSRLNLRVAARLMERFHLRYSLANGGEEALAKFVEDPTDIVFVDINMPGMNGFEVARRIRAMDFSKRVRMVALSGSVPKDLMNSPGSEFFDDFVEKPLSKKELWAVLERFVT